MKLTLVERLLISHQCRILGKLFPDEAADYDKFREAIEKGFTFHYDDMAQHFYDELSEEHCREVINILDMFSHLKRGYQSLKYKEGIEERDVEFYGFDGNNEPQYIGYVRYLIEREGRFENLKKGSHHGYDSHMPKLGQYRSMLREWERSQDKYKMTKDDIIRISKAV
jgi:uncharacterized protein